MKAVGVEKVALYTGTWLPADCESLRPRPLPALPTMMDTCHAGNASALDGSKALCTLVQRQQCTSEQLDEILTELAADNDIINSSSGILLLAE